MRLVYIPSAWLFSNLHLSYLFTSRALNTIIWFPDSRNSTRWAREKKNLRSTWFKSMNPEWSQHHGAEPDARLSPRSILARPGHLQSCAVRATSLPITWDAFILELDPRPFRRGARLITRGKNSLYYKCSVGCDVQPRSGREGKVRWTGIVCPYVYSIAFVIVLM